MTDIAQALDRIVPPYDGVGDWECVLRDAGLERRPRRRPLRLAAAVALVAAVIGVVALWPSGAGPSVIDRALAATGEGPVLHLVYESDLPHTLVDLETGERTELRAEHEVWFDPEAGLRETERFDGVVQFDVSLSDDEVSEHASSLYTTLAPATARRSSRAGPRSSAGRRRGNAGLLDQDRPEHPRRGRVPGDVRAGFHPRPQNGTTGSPGSLPTRTWRPARRRSGSPTPGLPSELGSYGADVELADAASLLARSPVWAGPDLHGFALNSLRGAPTARAGGADLQGSSA